MPDEHPSISDRPGGTLNADRLKQLARRVGPSPSGAIAAFRPALGWLLVFLVIFGVTLISFMAILQAFVHAREVVAAPDLKGLSLDKALQAASDAGLALSKESVEFNDAYPAGTVIRQIPAAGLDVRKGKIVRVTLSSGGKVIFVPELTEKPLAEAQNQMRVAGLVLGTLNEVYSQRFEAGWVMKQEPASGGIAEKNQMVDLTVSKGAPPDDMRLMPDFVNAPYDRARTWAAENGLTPKVTEELRSDVPPGVVIAQTPEPDAALDAKPAVAFTVSKSTAPVEGNAKTVRYDVPEGAGRVQVRILVRDERGEREVFQGYQDAGKAVEVPVSAVGAARARIFVNGVLIEESPVE